MILFNKWILATLEFPYPIFLTTWHLLFATIATQILARTTKMLDGRKTVKMTGRVYLRAIVPIGAFFSLSLICGNLAYLTLSVAFIQMLKATTPVAVLLAGWFLQVDKFDIRKLFNVSFIVIGVILATAGEITFVMTGFVFQVSGIVFEAIRLVMVQRLLSSSEFKMDPLVSLYYFAPVCAVLNFIVFMFVEFSTISMDNIYSVGLGTLLLNAFVAFALNVSVVFLVSHGVFQSVIMGIKLTVLDWANFIPRPHTMRCAEGHPTRGRVHHHMGNHRHPSPILRIRHRPLRSSVLQARRRQVLGDVPERSTKLE